MRKLIKAIQLRRAVPWTERKSVWRGALDLATGAYPAFVFGGMLGGGALPVFHFHQVTRGGLEPLLRYLAENRYRAVGADEITALVRHATSPGPRAVALCFDDAWASLWTVAAPLLRQYGLRALTYVSPARVPDGAPRPTLADDPAAAERADTSSAPFATWAELRALHAGGTVEIHPHAWRHAVVPGGPVIADFVRPGLTRHPHLWPWSVTEAGERFLTPADLGAPLYAQRSRLSDVRAWHNPGAIAACMAHVAQAGGADFFARPGWRAALARVAAAHAGRRETESERDAAIRADLAEARARLAAALNAAPSTHMCFPFAVAGRAAVRLAAATGYASAFADRLWGRRMVRAGDPPYQLMRLKHTFIPALPGAGRRVATAWKRRP